MIGLQDARVFHNAGVMERYTLHPYLGETYKQLAAPLSKVLAQMKQEGLFQKYDQMATEQSQ